MRKTLQNIINLFKQKKPTYFVLPVTNDNYRISYKNNNDFTNSFDLNLLKTIVWTEGIITKIADKSKIDYSKILRSTNPIYEGSPFYTFEDLPYLLNAASTPELHFNYDSVLNEVLRLRESTIIANETLHELGKILKFEIDVTTQDGAPCAESGFVDQMDVPPIDTWFYITQKYLYCWIPTMFIPKMQDAIDVECLGSYNWLEESDPELNRKAFNMLQKNGGLH